MYYDFHDTKEKSFDFFQDNSLFVRCSLYNRISIRKVYNSPCSSGSFDSVHTGFVWKVEYFHKDGSVCTTLTRFADNFSGLSELVKDDIRSFINLYDYNFDPDSVL